LFPNRQQVKKVFLKQKYKKQKKFEVTSSYRKRSLKCSLTLDWNSDAFSQLSRWEGLKSLKYCPLQ